MGTPAVVVRGLTKRFGAVEALRGLDLDIEVGRTCAVLGPNGAGKTTLLRILAGLARPSHGRIEVDGRTARGPAARARVGFVGHASLLYPELSARENLLFAARLYGVEDPGRRAERLLDELALGEFADRRTGALSRGLSQRLSIARALVHDPPLVLLDEPFTGLDRPAAERLVELLRGLRSEGRTLVLVTHATEHAAAVADQAVVLARGRVAHARGGEAGLPLAAAGLERAVEEAAVAPP